MQAPFGRGGALDPDLKLVLTPGIHELGAFLGYLEI
jgi:hypothetical protein